jgi:WD40 repeat protein/serine/threonine protein kinase
MVSHSSGRDPVEKLAEEFAERYRRGERPSLEEYATLHPELANQIRELFPALVEMEQLASVQGPRTGPYNSDVSALAAPEQLGEYRILREIGRGGMGVVYEAVQESLGRHVALKVLPLHGLLNKGQLERFSREAKAAARLHHTNIVPVFGVGEDSGIHYYAMQFIQGQSLDKVLEDVRRLRGGLQTSAAAADGPAPALSECVARGLLSGHFPAVGPDVAEAPTILPGHAAIRPEIPLSEATAVAGPVDTASGFGSQLSGLTETQYFRGVAQAGLQVAEALAYAHKQGILHRDIKPSNLLLDTRGTVWITDFGLAKGDDSDDLTHTGDLVGTLRFMAPERLERQCDVRSEVYSVGITLYEMLTLRPAFAKADRMALLDEVRSGHPPRPRRCDPRIPADLETIVLKAMARDPAERYATVEALAEDLRRFLADRPIRARRTPWHEQLWRWCRRNPAVASLTAAVAALLVCIAVGSFVTAVRSVKAKEALHAEQEATLEERGRAERAEREALESGLNSYVAALSRARAARFSRRMGQRYDALQALAEAATIARRLNLPQERIQELRNEAIACMALPDLRVVKEVSNGWPAGSVNLVFDAALERYARVDRQRNVSIRRLSDDREVWRISVGGGDRTLLFSPDGRYLAVRGYGPHQVWDLAGPEPIKLLELPAGGLTFSPDSRQFVIADADGAIGVYELPSGRRLRRLDPGPRPRELAFHPTDQRIAVAYDTGVQVRDLATGKVIANFPHASETYPYTAWHPDGKTLATVGRDHIIRLWDVATAREIAHLEGTKNGGVGFTFNHRGDLLASVSWDGMLRLWDPRTGKQLLSTVAYAMRIPQFSLDDRLLVARTNGTKIQILEVATGREYRTLVRDPVLGSGFYDNTAVSGDGRLLAAGMQDGFGLWDLDSGKSLAFVRQRWTPGVLFEHDGNLLTYGEQGLQRWPVRAGPAAPGHLRIGPPQMLSSVGAAGNVSSSRDGRVLATAGLNQGALILDANRLDRPLRLVHAGGVWGVTVSPDGRFVATGCQHGPGVKVWDAGTGKVVRVLRPQQVGCGVQFSPDGRWLAVGSGDLCLWSVGSWQEGLKIKAAGGIAFSPDSKLLAVEPGEGAIRLIDLDTGREFTRLEDPDQDRMGGLCLTPDGTQLIGCTNDSQSIHIWDLRAIRRRLAEIDLDWDPPTKWEDNNPDRAAPLQVEVIQPEPAADPLALNNEAWRLVTGPEKLRDPAKALALIQAALKRRPGEPLFLNTLGVVHYRNGQYREAAATLEKSLAASRGQSDAFDLFFLAMCHHHLGDAAKARDCYDRALQWRREHKNLSPQHAEELKAFQAEAEALLRLRVQSYPASREC